MIGCLIAVLNMSILATLLFLFTMLWRKMLQKIITRNFCCVLWIPFFARLFLPASFSSPISIFNLFSPKTYARTNQFTSVAYLDPAEQVLHNTNDFPSQTKKVVLLALAVLWLGGTIFFLLRYAVQSWHLRGLIHQGTRCDERFVPLFSQVGISRKIEIVFCPEILSPVAYGSLRPKILFPCSWEKHPSESIQDIAIHELVHLKRRDPLFLLVAQIALCLHWFNPAVWWAYRLLRRDIECACDEKVLSFTDEQGQLQYAQALADFSKKAYRQKSLQRYAMFGDSDVVFRMRKILSYREAPRFLIYGLSFLTLLFVLCTMTNPLIKSNIYTPHSTVFISSEQKQRFQRTAEQLAQALATGDTALLMQISTLDPQYYQPLMAPFQEVRIAAKEIRIYYISSVEAEAYYTVKVENSGDIFLPQEQTLVAHFRQVSGDCVILADCLMPKEKYENIRLLEDSPEKEAVQLVKRLLAIPPDENFSSQTLDATTIASVCMASEVSNRPQRKTFTQKQLQQLAQEYFGISEFYCHDSSVYDAATNTYYYTEWPAPNASITKIEKNGAGVIIDAEIYADPLKIYPEQIMRVTLQKTSK